MLNKCSNRLCYRVTNLYDLCTYKLIQLRLRGHSYVTYVRSLIDVRSLLNFYIGKSEHARVKTHEEDIVVIQYLSVICYGILTVTRTLEQSFDFRG